jgi:hypothetical protein
MLKAGCATLSRPTGSGKEKVDAAMVPVAEKVDKDKVEEGEKQAQ